MKKNTQAWSLVLISVIAGIVGGFLGAKFRFFGTDTPQNVIENIVYIEESQTIDAINKVSSAVVSIRVYKDVSLDSFGLYGEPLFIEPFINGERKQNFEDFIYSEVSGGTGFLVTSDGLFLTNKHVVADEDADYRVILSDGTEYNAEVVSKDPFDDVAVVRVLSDRIDFPIVEFGDSENIKVGQKVLAIGNALGQYQNTVTSGIISAVGRDVSAYADFGDILNFSGLLQTDAAINFGNSGGPLVGLDGKVIGMNVAVADYASGVSFAIPINELKPVLVSVEMYGEIVRPVLGVRFIILSEASENDLELTRGAMIVADEGILSSGVVEGGPADLAGLKVNDVILKINDEEITIDYPLQKIIRKYMPGDEVTVQYWRDGVVEEVTLVLESSAKI